MEAACVNCKDKKEKQKKCGYGQRLVRPIYAMYKSKKFE